MNTHLMTTMANCKECTSFLCNTSSITLMSKSFKFIVELFEKMFWRDHLILAILVTWKIYSAEQLNNDLYVCSNVNFKVSFHKCYEFMHIKFSIIKLVCTQIQMMMMILQKFWIHLTMQVKILKPIHYSYNYTFIT